MISSYRLGDLILLELTKDEKKLLCCEQPYSMGAYYLSKYNHLTDIDEKITAFTNIVLEFIEKYDLIKLLPPNIEDSTVIHLRLGDVVAGNEWHELDKRPIPANDLLEIVSMNTTPIYIIGKCFFAKDSSKNYEECIEKSNEYLDEVLTTLNNATHFKGKTPDIDLCAAIKAKHFIPGKGYFSKLIVEIRKKLIT